MSTSVLHRVCRFIATGFGIGYLVPIGQGTIAAALAVPLVPLYWKLPFVWQIACVLVGSAIGVYTAHVAAADFQTHDDHRIVIDEIVSIFLTFFAFSFSGIPWVFLGVGLVLNRLFDWWKPLFINTLQRAPGGWGIMLDDLAVGVVTGAMLHGVLAFVAR